MLLVFWGDGGVFPLYNNASSNIRLVGKEIGLIVGNIREIFFPNFPKELNVHCIGHSLGAVLKFFKNKFRFKQILKFSK